MRAEEAHLFYPSVERESVRPAVHRQCRHQPSAPTIGAIDLPATRMAHLYRAAWRRALSLRLRDP